MTITIVCDVLGKENNGTTIAAMNLIRSLQERGHSVRVVCSDPERAGKEGYYVVPRMNLGPLNSYVIRFLNSHDGYSLKELQRSIHSIMSAFTKVFGALIPAYALQFFRERIDYDTEGTTTSSYEEVKEFYIDAYETLGNLLIIPVALNNILYRGNYDQLDSSIDNGGSLKDFIAKTKANRFHFCSKTEKYIVLWC